MNKKRTLINIIFYYILPPFLLLSIPILAYAQVASGLCPLPVKYMVELNANPKPNSMHFMSVEREGKSAVMLNGATLYSQNIPEPIPSSCDATFVVNEDDENTTYGFKVFSSSGNSFYPADIISGSNDQTTGSDFKNWMPKMKIYHPLSADLSRGKKQMSQYPKCYDFMGGSEENPDPTWIKWSSNDGWKVNTVYHAYHMDSPTLYGVFGNIGYNPKENVPGEGKKPFKFTYYTPSVPTWYVASSVLSITWDWPYQYQHAWNVHHTPDDAWVKCSVCGAELAVENVVEKPYWTDLKDCVKPAINWPADYFYFDKAQIQNPQVAEQRNPYNTLYDARQGVPSKIYNPAVNFELPWKPVVIARATIRVADLGNIAHVQIGIDGENSNVLKAECGKKISEAEGDKTMLISIVDNAVQASELAVCGEVQDLSAEDAKWADINFKAIFWHETPLYQYASYPADVFKDNTGQEKQLLEIIYSPMFIWKKKSWNSLSDFLSTRDNSAVKSFFYNHDNKENGFPIDPCYVIYKKKIRVSDLFTDDDSGIEDIIPWHYAKTSLGDMFGNPAYNKGENENLYGSDFKDRNGNQVIESFKKYKPMNFLKGKGPLKYFMEVHDGSAYTGGSGRKNEEKNYNCGGTYIKEYDYTQGLLKYNPQACKYVQYSQDSASLEPGVPIDTCAPDMPCLAEKYDEHTNIWINNPDLLNGPGSSAGGEITQYFQAFGMIDITDTLKPNVGLKITNMTTNVTRKIYKINDMMTLPFYSDLISNEGENWALIDNKVKTNLWLIENSTKPRHLYSLNSENDTFWEFSDVKFLIEGSSDGKIYEGRDTIKDSAGNLSDSMDPYGLAENTQIETVHQDLRNDPQKTNFSLEYFAHDNIDGQRITRRGSEIEPQFWYKGLNSYNFEKNQISAAPFAKNIIGKGYFSWVIKDDTAKGNLDDQFFRKNYMSGDNYIYPLIAFNNPNCKWDGTPLGSTLKEIAVSYGVIDRAGNKRKFKLNFYVAPVELKIQTIEKKEKRNN